MKRLNCRGSAIIEYTVILAFIASVATSFIYSDSFKDPIVQITNRVIAMLGGNPNVLKGNSVGLPGFALIGYSDNAASTKFPDRVAIVGPNSKPGQDNLIELAPNQDYEIVVDLNEFSKQTNLDQNKFELCLFLWETDDSTKKAAMDTGSMSVIKDGEYKTKYGDGTQYEGKSVTATYNSDNNTVTYSFKTEQNAYMGINLAYGRIKSESTNSQLQSIADTYQSYVTVQKASK